MRAIIDLPGQIDISIILCTHVFKKDILNSRSKIQQCIKKVIKQVNYSKKVEVAITFGSLLMQFIC